VCSLHAPALAEVMQQSYSRHIVEPLSGEVWIDDEYRHLLGATKTSRMG
jgi:hypothetical protein